MTPPEALGAALVASALLFLFAWRWTRRDTLRVARIRQWHDHRTHRRMLDSLRRRDLLRVRIAYHEAGHALIAWRSPYAERGIRVQVGDKDGLTTFFNAGTLTAHLAWELVSYHLAGAAAESLRFRQTDLCGRGGEGYLDNAIDMAEIVVATERARGKPVLPRWHGCVPQGEDADFDDVLSGVPCPPPDPRVQDVLRSAYAYARYELRTRSKDLDRVAAYAVVHRDINGMHIRRLIGDRPRRKIRG